MKTKPFNLEEALAGKPWGHYGDASDSHQWQLVGRGRHPTATIVAQDERYFFTEFNEKYLYMIVEPLKYKGLLVLSPEQEVAAWLDCQRHREILKQNPLKWKVIEEFEVEYDLPEEK